MRYWHFEVRDPRGKQLELVQLKTKKGTPRCLFCDKPIPRFRRSLAVLPSADAAFHSDECAVRFAMQVLRDVVRHDPPVKHAVEVPS